MPRNYQTDSRNFILMFIYNAHVCKTDQTDHEHFNKHLRIGKYLKSKLQTKHFSKQIFFIVEIFRKTKKKIAHKYPSMNSVVEYWNLISINGNKIYHLKGLLFLNIVEMPIFLCLRQHSSIVRQIKETKNQSSKKWEINYSLRDWTSNIVKHTHRCLWSMWPMWRYIIKSHQLNASLNVEKLTNFDKYPFGRVSVRMFNSVHCRAFSFLSISLISHFCFPP